VTRFITGQRNKVGRNTHKTYKIWSKAKRFALVGGYCVSVIDAKLMRALRLGADVGQLVARSGAVSEFRRGELVFQQDAMAENCFFIVDGAVKLVRSRQDDREVLVKIIAEGDTYFDPGIFEAGKYQARGEAVARTRILCIARNTLSDVMTCRPEFAFAVLAAIADQYAQFVNQIEQLKSQSVSQRIASFLLKQIKATKGPAVLYLPYEKWLIAESIGARPESFSRALRHLRKIGVQMSRDRVEIQYLGKLYEHACAES
jgi:CRP-like cAMP-binding protein